MIKPIFIGGKWREGAEKLGVASPFSGKLIAETFWAGESELEEAIAAAEGAKKEMARLARFEISEGLRKIAEGIEGRKAEIAETICAEAAKPILLSKGEADRAIHTFRIASEEAKRFTGEIIIMDAQAIGKGKSAHTERIPRGVIFGISPFNFPLNLVAHKAAPALASGNAIIIKPSPRTPLTALLLAEIFAGSGLPQSALQVINLKNELTQKAIEDERIAMISFTGSAEIGWAIKAKAGRKQVALEMGGNAPVIIDEGVDIDKTISRAVTAAFAYSGQICISAQRFYLHEKIFDQWTAKFIEKTKNLKFGDPADEGANISVMIDEAAAIRAESWINEAKAQGARILLGGKRDGAYLEPTILTETTPEMKIVSEEAFAPICIAERFTDFEDAVNFCNQGKYGLQCGVFTNDLARSRYAAKNLAFGAILINEMPIFRVDNMPYGGIKESGFGREGVKYAMEEMSEIKLIVNS